MICSSSPRGRHTDTCVVWSDCPFNSRLFFDDQSHHVWLFPLSVSLSHTHTCISLFPGPGPLFLSFISPAPCFEHFFFSALPPCSCLTTFEVCHSSCFVGPYSLISTSLFVILVQFHFQVVTVGRSVQLTIVIMWRCFAATQPKLEPWSVVELHLNAITQLVSLIYLLLFSILLLMSSLSF